MNSDFTVHKFKSFLIIMNNENKKQNKPAKATVVNLGVSILQRKLTENIENPSAETKPNINPGNVFSAVFPIAITIMPKVATNIAIHTVIETFSFKNKKPNNAVMKGIAARQRRVIAAVVFVIDQMNVIIAKARPVPPIIPEVPIFL